jgi:hypothetical protein
MWESRRDFQRGWEAGFMAFHASTLCHFHGLLFTGNIGYDYATGAMRRTAKRLS